MFLELSEASEKILQLFSNIIGGSEKERVCLIMRGIHALLELFYHRHQDPVRIINALTICKFIISENFVYLTFLFMRPVFITTF